MKKIIFAMALLSSIPAFASSQMDCVGKTDPQIRATIEIVMDQTIHTTMMITNHDTIIVNSTNTQVKFGDGPEIYRGGGATLKLVDKRQRNIRDREELGDGVESYTYDTRWELSNGFFKTAMICSRSASNM